MIFIRTSIVALMAIHLNFATANDSIRLSNHYDACKNPTTIQFKLTNETDKSTSTIKGGLPWFNGPFGVRLYAFHNQAAPTKIRQIYGIQSNFDEIEIQSNSHISGNIYLLERFPELGSLIGADDIYIFWFYEFLDTKKRKTDASNGMILIPADLKSRCRGSASPEP